MNANIFYENATGTIDYGMTNDYMFRAVEITNPIILGEHIDAKTFILDIHVLLNDSRLINLEMQMTNQGDWRECSLSYLCCTYDQLNKGEDYINAKPVIHIGFPNSSRNFTPPINY